jgi:uncharacterized protein (TIGR03435 family)
MRHPLLRSRRLAISYALVILALARGVDAQRGRGAQGSAVDNVVPGCVGPAASNTGRAGTVRPAFDAASIKHVSGRPTSFPPSPDRFHQIRTVNQLVEIAYNVWEFRLFGGPDWVREDLFDVNAKAACAASNGDMQQMLQSLLEDRFMLAVHKEQREMRLYSLVLARNDGRLGKKLERCEDPATSPGPTRIPLPSDALPFAGRCESSALIAGNASQILKGPVADKTGLSGFWNYLVAYSPIRPQASAADQLGTPSLATAIQEELGLKLEPGRGPVDVLVIDSVQPPSED